MIIKFTNYCKLIKKKSVLSNINLTLKSGKIYGLHGRNGSGKTMLLRADCGLILPTSGAVFVDDKQIGKDIEFPDSIGVIIDHMMMNSELNGFDNLKALAKIKKTATSDDICNAMIAVGLDPKDKKKVKAYSLGMKQKLNIAQALMENPRLLLLDEPTNALDSETIEKVRELFIKKKKEGSLIVIASHNKEDLEILCDEIIEIDQGEIKNQIKFQL